MPTQWHQIKKRSNIVIIISSYPRQRRPLAVVAGLPGARCDPLSAAAVAAAAAVVVAAGQLAAAGLLPAPPGPAPPGRAGCPGCWGWLASPAAPLCWPPAPPPWAGPSYTQPGTEKLLKHSSKFPSTCHWPFCFLLCESESHRPCPPLPRARKWRIQSHDVSWFVGPLTWRLHQPCLQQSLSLETIITSSFGAPRLSSRQSKTWFLSHFLFFTYPCISQVYGSAV